MIELGMLREILSPSARKSFIILLGVTFLSALSTLVGVGSVLPFMAMVANPRVVHENEHLHKLYTALGAPGDTTFLIILGGAMLVALTLSNGLTALATFAGLTFTAQVSHELSTRLLRSYLARPYVWFLDKSSSNLGKNILAEVNQAVTGFIQPLAGGMVQALTTVLLLALIVAIDPLMAAATALIFGGVYSVTYVLLRRRIRHYGQTRLKKQRKIFKTANEALQGVRDIKLLHCREEFADEYSGAAREVYRLKAYAGALSTLPRHVMETATIGGLIALIIYLLFTEGAIEKVLPILTLYAVCGLRLMPAVQLIYNTAATMRFNAPALHRLHRDLTALPEPSRLQPDEIPRWEFSQVIEFKNVTFRYPETEDPVIKNIWVDIPKNASIAFVGGTGAGKTTLVNMLLGLLSPTAGAIVVDGQPLNEDNVMAWQRSLGYVPQDIFLLDASVLRNIAFGVPLQNVDRAKVEHAARIANIHDFITSDLPHGYDTPIGERGIRLSGGQRQRIGIARALYREPSVLILDEATSALDGATETAVVEAIQRVSRSHTVIMIAHRLTTIKDCDRIYLLQDGQISDSGNFEELLQKNMTFQSFAKSS